MELHHEETLPATGRGAGSNAHGLPAELAESTESTGRPRGIRLRVGLGAGVVLVLLAAALAVLISATASRPASATVAGYSSAPGGSSKTSAKSSTTDDSSGSTESSVGAVGTGSASGGSTTAFVQVVGQVQKPGLYELPAGDRIVDAVAAAGGFSAKADQASLNLAQVIADGQQIVVGARGAPGSGSVGAGAVGVGAAAGGAAGSAQVDINTADETGLETLDGIGPALAARILAYRTAHGGFRAIGDLQNVTGIGPKKFAAIKASVSV